MNPYNECPSLGFMLENKYFQFDKKTNDQAVVLVKLGETRWNWVIFLVLEVNRIV